MWIVIVQYDFGSDIFIHDDLVEAESMYTSYKQSGQVVFLTSVIETNM